MVNAGELTGIRTACVSSSPITGLPREADSLRTQSRLCAGDEDPRGPGFDKSRHFRFRYSSLLPRSYVAVLSFYLLSALQVSVTATAFIWPSSCLTRLPLPRSHPRALPLHLHNHLCRPLTHFPLRCARRARQERVWLKRGRSRSGVCGGWSEGEAEEGGNRLHVRSSSILLDGVRERRH